MDDKDYEYIQKEFKDQNESNMKPIHITKQLIDKLLNKYNACGYTELYYDDEATDEDRKHSSKEYTDKEWEEYTKNYDTRAFNNWCDPYEEGTWGLTNNRVRKIIRSNLNDFLSTPASFYYSIKYYLRDKNCLLPFFLDKLLFLLMVGFRLLVRILFIFQEQDIQVFAFKA